MIAPEHRRGLFCICLLALGINNSVWAGVTINPTWDASINNDPNAATIKATISAAIDYYAHAFSDNVQVNIKFQEGGGLGGSSTNVYQYSYADYRMHLIGDAKTATDLTAIAMLPNQVNSPVDGSSLMWLTAANARAVGLRANPSDTTTLDATITLNTSIMFLSRAAVSPSKYDLYSVTQHEVNEVLGLGSGLDLATTFPRLSRPEDLFRYSASGVRSFTTSTSATSYFSINGGATNLAGFNQSGTGDYGDWNSASVRTQNAFGTAGATPNLGVELTALDAIGFDLASPEPATWVAALMGVGALVAAARSRRGQD